MALSLDGHATANTGAGTSVAPNLTTTAGSGVIVVLYVANAAPAASNPVTASGLVFGAPRISTNDGGDYFAEFTAPYTSNFSGSITVQAASSTYLTALAFGIGGAATSNYYDSNVSLPAVNNTGGTSISITTSNADDFIFGFGVSPIGSGNPWIEIDTTAASNFCYAAYQIVSATQSGLVYTDSSAVGIGGDAIIQASAATGGTTTPLRMLIGMGT